VRKTLRKTLRKISFKKGASIILLALMIAALKFSMSPTNVKAQAGAALSIIPAANTFNALTTPVNSTFTVNATLTNVILLWDWQINVTFDPNMLNCISAGIPADSPFNFPLQPTPVINNTAGYVQFGASQLTGPGVNGSGVLGTITFKIISAPTPGGTLSCGINYSRPYGVDTFLLDPNMVEIPATLEDGYYEYTWPLLSYTLTIAATYGGTTDPAPGSYSYVAGTNVTVTAYPAGFYVFDHWGLDGVNYTVNPITVTMNANHTLQAVFVLSTCTLTITTTTGGTTSPAPGSYSYTAGTNVAVAALPSVGYNFSYWELDGINKTENPINVTMAADHTLHAVFNDVTPPTIVEVTQDPPAGNVLENQAVKVSVNVTDLGSGVKNVTLIYTPDNWSTSISLNTTVNSTSGLWKAEIPGKALNTLVQYEIVSYDNAGNKAEKPVAGQYYSYTVIPEFTTFSILLILAAMSFVLVLTKKFRKSKAYN
jgi:hypothetical protein